MAYQAKTVISIHAPVKGATSVQGFAGISERSYFNPRTREGCDARQFTVQGTRLPDFNPRTREGCDVPKRALERRPGHISIHAPVKGATEL